MLMGSRSPHLCLLSFPCTVKAQNKGATKLPALHLGLHPVPPALAPWSAGEDSVAPGPHSSLSCCLQAEDHPGPARKSLGKQPDLSSSLPFPTHCKQRSGWEKLETTSFQPANHRAADSTGTFCTPVDVQLTSQRATGRHSDTTFLDCL